MNMVVHCDTMLTLNNIFISLKHLIHISQSPIQSQQTKGSEYFILSGICLAKG